MSSFTQKVTIFLGSLMVSFLVVLAIRIMDEVKGGRSAEVESALENPEQNSIRMILQWGGFYAVPDGDGYSVFRLLDIDSEGYHVVNFERRFLRRPALNEVSFLVPSRGHEVLRGAELLSLAPDFIGRKPLRNDDLVGYKLHLESRNIRGLQLYERLDRIKRSSWDVPLLADISVRDGVLKFEAALKN